MTQTIEWDPILLQKYNISGPRYTSYPTALEFSERYREADFVRASQRTAARSLSLYIHIPFCHRLCYFCGCNKVVTRHQHKADDYLAALAVEIAHRAALFRNRTVTQMHWGGGTPTFLSKEQISTLMALLRRHFAFSDEAELSIEIDPREIEVEMIDHLFAAGFTRLSMGVQDFNKEVQEKVNRVQDEQTIVALIERAKRVGFSSVNLDLIYGLPKQTPESFAFTLKKVIALNPDRLSVFNYAHMPEHFAAQRKIREEDLPDPLQKLTILQQSIAALMTAGYQFIGMDHFARPEDELAVAQREGRLHRNFQGYTTQGENDLLGLGVSAISMMGDSYAQNQKTLKDWYDAVATQGTALWRGVELSRDDILRREVIKTLMCNFSLDFAAFAALGVNFTDYFAEDLPLLDPLMADGLVERSEKGLQVTAKGRLLVRNICMCFDRYLRQQRRLQQFSRVI